MLPQKPEYTGAISLLDALPHVEQTIADSAHQSR
jgi:hypothetical protein